jgi:HEAT repeat protein
MHPVDELLAIYPGQDSNTQKYLVSALGRAAADSEPAAVPEFLWREAASPIASVRHQARRELGQVLLVHHARDYALPARPPAAGGSGAFAAEASRLVAIGLDALRPAIERALGLMEKGSHTVRQAASLAAGASRLVSVVRWLTERVAAGKASFSYAVALSEIGSSDSAEALLSAARNWGLGGSDLAFLLASAPPDRALPILKTMESRTDAYGRANIALALAGDRRPESRELLLKLIARREGWVTAYCLDALMAGPPRAEDLAVARDVFESERHEFIRIQAIGLASALAGPEALAFLADRLPDPSPRVRAAALEAMVRRRCDPSAIRQAARPLLSSALLKARVNAILALARTDPLEVAPAVEGLLFADRPLSRVEGAYVLGYMEGADSIAVLHEMATSDPSSQVRLQAVKSLGRQPGRAALERVLSLAVASDARTGAQALRTLHAMAEADGATVEPIAAGLTEAAKSGHARALLPAVLRTLGLVSVRGSVPAAHDLLEQHLSGSDPDVVLGALEGLKVHAPAGARAALADLVRHADPRIRTAAWVSATWAGEWDLVRSVCDLLDSRDDDKNLAGLNALLEVLTLLPAAAAAATAGQAPRFEPMVRSLASRPGEASYTELVRQDVMPVAGEHGSDPLLRAAWEKSESPRQLLHTGERLRATYAGAGARAARAARGAAPARVPAEALDEISYIGPSPIRATRRLRLPAWAAPVLAIVALALLGAWFRGPRPDVVATDPETRRRTAVFKVASINGPAHQQVDGGEPQALAPGARIQSRALVRTGPAAVASLVDALSDSIWLEGSSQIRVAPPPPGAPSLYFSDPRGDLTLDLRPGGLALVDLGPARLSIRQGLVRLRDAGGVRQISVTQGEVTLSAPGSPDRTARAGQSLVVDGPRP